MILNQTELADLLGVAPRTLRRWTADGLPRREDGAYDVEAVVKWYSGRLHAEGVAEGRRLERDEASGDVDARRKLALARTYELNLAERTSDLVHKQEALDYFERVLARIRAVMLALPGRIVPLLTRYKLAEALAIIEPAVHESMESMSMAGRPDEEDGDDDEP